MENYLPLALIIIALVGSLIAKKYQDNFYVNLIYIIAATVVIVAILLDFPDDKRVFSIALLGYAVYSLVDSIIRMRKLTQQKKLPVC